MPNTEYSENNSLVAEYKNGSLKAREKLIEKNLRLVKSIAKRFSDRGTEFEDLVEIGTIGLIKSIDGFDESYGFSFSTYAYPFIIGEIRRFLRDDGLVKISRIVKKNISLVMEAKDNYSKMHGKEPKISELSNICNLPSEIIAEALSASNPVISLQDKLSQDNNDTTIEELIPDEDFVSKLTITIALRQEISKLTEYEKNIINLRYFKNCTQADTAKRLGQSQVTISRAERKIIDKLRQEIL